MALKSAAFRGNELFVWAKSRRTQLHSWMTLRGGPKCLTTKFWGKQIKKI